MSIKNIVIGLAVIILTIFVVIYGIGTFYSEPKYEDFCGVYKDLGVINNSVQCEGVGGKWVIFEEGALKPTNNPNGWCDADYVCRTEYENKMETYSRNLFLICLPLGILIIVAGALIFGLESVGAGLMGGGVGTIIYGAGNYWRYSGELLKFLLSLAGLVVVIYFAYWWNKKKKE